MKKVLWLIVCLMTMVIGFTSCDNIDEDATSALEKFEKWRSECIYSHADSDVDEIITAFREKLKKKEKVSTVNPDLEAYSKAFESDMKLIIQKSLEPLFKKYGEKKVIELLENKANAETYKNIKFSSKEDLYNRLIDASISFYLEKLKSKFELESLKLESEMINNMY